MNDQTTQFNSRMHEMHWWITCLGDH